MKLFNTKARKRGRQTRGTDMTERQFIKFLRLLLLMVEKCKTVDEVKEEIEKLLQE